ncbi:MAG: saccharopine dehydrogenase C-terminal domain-containing protein [Euryarchaeota archaeon]|nr:saccharopine dehydrogenase C-terminal domain-containing protein [Euryarchaeota archaeon]
MKFLILGFGRVGEAIADYLKEYDVGVVDSSGKALKKAKRSGFEAYNEDITKNSIVDTMRQYDCVISAVPYMFNYELARKALKAGTNFCDLGGNNTIVDKELNLHEEAKKKEISVLPDCGLAPGLADILAAFGYSDDCKEIRMRVGGVPKNPQGSLKYKIVFSPEGLINEYVEKARIIKNGKIKYVESLTGLEKVEFGNKTYEAFYTSGGTSTLPRTFKGKLEYLDYKTIRYPGHCSAIKPLLELGFADRDEMTINGDSVIPRKVLVRLLSENLSYETEDVVLLRVTAEGKKRMIYEMVDHEKEFTAMVRTTAYPAALSALLITKKSVIGAIPQEILIPQLISEKQYLTDLEKKDITIEKRIEKV